MTGTFTQQDPYSYATVPQQPHPYEQTYATTGHWQQQTAWTYPGRQVVYEPEPEFRTQSMLAHEYSYENECAYDEQTAGPNQEPEIPTKPGPEPEAGSGPNRNSAPSSLPHRRRKRPPKRSALLTVAVPSAAVMGVAACAAVTVTAPDDHKDATRSQADGPGTGTVATTLDRPLAGVSRDADAFAARAGRTQERLDLKERQAVEKQKKAAAAAAKEAARPKFLLPVTQKGLSAYFGQAGVNWMSVHTGIDFPVSYGTPVMAATDGTVHTQWNSAYGNMAIVTAADGTETWYCHLSSTRFRSGPVQAGEVIAYSGNSGNSTGPHLHFEVRPRGGAAVDPIPWLLAKGLDPR
jgi:murein DD-endopeptidase MepM/ murein hydrolase activator NlpD